MSDIESLNDEIADLNIEICQLTKERDELAAKIDPMWREMVSHRHKAQGNYWAWDKEEEENHLVSLGCPVLIHPQELRAILKERDELRAKLERAEACANERLEAITEWRSEGFVVIDADDPILSTQCGVGLLEKVKRLREALVKVIPYIDHSHYVGLAKQALAETEAE